MLTANEKKLILAGLTITASQYRHHNAEMKRTIDYIRTDDATRIKLAHTIGINDIKIKEIEDVITKVKGL